MMFEGLLNDVFRPVDRSWSRDTAVACFCCCDGADAAATELILRVARVPPRAVEVPPRPCSSRCCWQHPEEGRGGTSRGDARCAQHQLRRSSISSTRRAE